MIFSLVFHVGYDAAELIQIYRIGMQFMVDNMQRQTVSYLPSRRNLILLCIPCLKIRTQALFCEMVSKSLKREVE